MRLFKHGEGANRERPGVVVSEDFPGSPTSSNIGSSWQETQFRRTSIDPISPLAPKGSRGAWPPGWKLVYRLTHLQFLEGVFYLCHVRALSGSLVKGQVLVDSDQSQALPPW